MKNRGGLLPPGRPLFTEQCGEVLKGKRNYAAAAALLRASGYNSEKIVLMAATDQPPAKAQADVTAALLGRVGRALSGAGCTRVLIIRIRPCRWQACGEPLLASWPVGKEARILAGTGAEPWPRPLQRPRPAAQRAVAGRARRQRRCEG